MARPKPDEDLIKAQLLDAAERLLARYGPAKVTVTEIASECGMSQSNAYRYYPTKQALMAAFAARWFSEVEAKLAEIAQGQGTPRARLRHLLKTQLAIKIERHDRDPALFRAYLELAAANPAAVAAHSKRLSSLIDGLVAETSDGLSGRKINLAATTQAILDATLMVRDPWLIARFRDALDKERADSLIDLAISALD
ncbi:TetR/AcrR family transcriptional regulator [Chelativorans sp. YIM 93263]|uniref:TetR/AcrR family transcriptional regulator n=1 Tax=Chelativorans sp. YIM 93263 TaxID=2906648 RepID=UPI002377E9F5|nr:TetR/AcrR family transcriptional regulator [Chelativorans sp. YIM 93263]